jgi:hypothetical protein
MIVIGVMNMKKVKVAAAVIATMVMVTFCYRCAFLPEAPTYEECLKEEKVKVCDELWGEPKRWP